MLVEEILKLEPNKKIEGTFAVVNVSLKPFKEKEGCYLAFFLQDKTGRVPGKIWDNAEKFKDKIIDDVVIFLRGKTDLFSGKNQVIIDEFEIKEDFDLNNFLLASKLNVDEMLQELKNILFSEMEDTELSAFLEKEYFEDENFVKQFKNCPGGKGGVHHAYLHGLLEHTLGVMKLCEDYSCHYLLANRDLLRTGALLHDLGKLLAYSYKISIEMTDIGRLHGHTALGYISFLNKLSSFEGMNQEKKTEYGKLLGHMILSHHGSIDKQAIMLPMTLEAMLLAKADSTDAEANFISKTIEEKLDDWSAFNNLTNRSYYNEKKNEQKEEDKKLEEKPKKNRKGSKTTLYEYKE